MDHSLAAALDTLRDIAHQEDPDGPVGIEGTQMPHAFGGYDLWRLSRVLDWVEPYDIGNAREIFGSFMPGKPLLTTVFETETNPARRRLWHLSLLGDRGCIVWWSKDCLDWSSPDYKLTAKAQALRPVLEEMTSPLAQLFRRAERQSDPIALLYSQASIQVDWLIESTVDGSTWLRRFSSFEASHNRMAQVRNSWLKAFQDLGFSPRFISSAQLEQGDLEATNCRALVLDQALALSDLELNAIHEYGAPASNALERVLFCDGSPGLFDQHGKLRSSAPLTNWFPLLASSNGSYALRSHRNNSDAQTAHLHAGDIASYARERLGAQPSADWPEWIRAQLPDLRPSVRVPLQDHIRVHRFRLGPARLVAFERNINYQMSEELKEAGGNSRLENPIDTEATLDAPAHVYDLRTEEYLGRTDRIRFHLDPWRPSLFALLPERLPAGPVVEQLLKATADQHNNAILDPPASK